MQDIMGIDESFSHTEFHVKGSRRVIQTGLF